MENFTWNHVIPLLITYGVKIILAIAILFFGRFLAAFGKKMLKNMLVKTRMDATVISFLANFAYIILLLIFIIVALGVAGVQTASFVAIIGAAGLTIGLSLQGSLGNFVSGVLIVIFKPFKIGDYIEAGGSGGTVEEIGIFTTTLRSADNKIIIIPNTKVSADSIINYSAKENRRIEILVGVSYNTNLDNAKKILEEIVNAEIRILKDPAAVIAVMELAESSVNIVVRPWVKTEDYWDVFFMLQEQIKKRFDNEGIEIPFPQRDIHFYQQK